LAANVHVSRLADIGFFSSFVQADRGYAFFLPILLKEKLEPADDMQ
jgi:hypothetical protein